MSNFAVKVLILFTISFATSQNSQQNSNISAGSGSTSGDSSDEIFLVTGGFRPEYPYYTKYVASIRFKKGHGPYPFFGINHYCSGAIISPYYIITAAHCLAFEAHRIEVVVGTTRRLLREPFGQVLDVSVTIEHPHFVATTGETADVVLNDIGLIKLVKPIQIDNLTTAITHLNQMPLLEDSNCTLIGWGQLYENGPMPDKIVYTTLSIIHEDICRETYTEKNSDQFCAGNPDDAEHDGCQGDSGGPLFCNDVLTGIVSYGDSCGANEEGGIYTDISSHLDFINLYVKPKMQELPQLKTLCGCLICPSKQSIIILVLYHSIFLRNNAYLQQF